MGEINHFINMLSPRLSKLILNCSELPLDKVTELRLRKGKPLIIYVESKGYFISVSGHLCASFNNSSVIVNCDEFEEVVNKICNNSFHTNKNTMLNGYITTRNGSRVGICSSAVYHNSVLSSVKDITALNIRIAVDHKGCSREILSKIYQDKPPSIIVASLPSMGKTTFLRDFARIISSGYKGYYCKSVIIDERGEITSGFDTGINTDVIFGFSKADGIEMAIRTMSPEIIICDEIGTYEELEKIRFGFSSGVSFAVSVHSKSADVISADSIAYKLISSGNFDYLIILEEYTRKYKIFNLRDGAVENCRNNDCNISFNSIGNYVV